MKLRTFLLLLACLGLTANATDKAATIRVLCYNIHYGQGMDRKYDVERIARVIAKFKPDVVALQEIDVGVERSGRVHQIRELGRLTGMASRYGPTQHYQGGLYGNGILTKLPILDVAIHPLPYTEATKERTTYPRGAIAAKLKAANGTTFRFISTHFQHNVPEDRHEEAKAINKLFAGEKEATPTILAGDMNAAPGSDPINELLKRWTHSSNEPDEPTAPSTKPRARIDYIFHRPADRFRLIESKVINEPMASDHQPVLAVLELR
ncbi:MAG: endonuclease [Verrucomicrobiales bacterium]|nr:endonuclease [Verrucomicrobiales bacterium]|tara:strand:- start:7964 stop:8758 length:795 start_codon:yes stop_codon:yes gene_type:complete